MRLRSPREILIEDWCLNWRNLRGWQCHLEMAALTMLRVEQTMDILKGLLVIICIKDHLCHAKGNQRSFSIEKKKSEKVLFSYFSTMLNLLGIWLFSNSGLQYGQYFVIFLLEQVEPTFSFRVVTSGETEGSTDGSDTNGAGVCSFLMINLCTSI